MGDWKQTAGKLAYMFGELRGWTPGADVISAVRGGVYNCQNVRFDEGKIKTRGGWAQFTTGDTDVTSIFGFRSSGTQRLVSVKQPTSTSGILREYDFSDSAWDDDNLVARFLNTADQDYTVMPKSDGTDLLIMTDGVNQNLKWNFAGAPVELTSKIIFDAESDESWAFSDAGSISTAQQRTGTSSILLTDDSAGGDTGTISFSTPSYSYTTGSSYNTLDRIGDLTNVERAIAIKVDISEDTTFDRVSINLYRSGTPSGIIDVRCETDSGGEPSGDLIDANAYNDATTGPTGDDGLQKWWNVDLQASVTYNQTFWIVFNAVNQTGGESWRVRHRIYFGGNTLYSDDDGSTWTALTSYYSNIILYDTTGNLDLDTDYDDGDEIVLWAYLDDTLSDISEANSSIKFVVDVSNDITYDFTAETFSAGTWTQIIVARDTDGGDANWTVTGTMDWSSISSIVLTVTDGGSDVSVYFDSCYIRKSKVNASVGSQERPFIAKYCEPSPYGDRVLLANTEVTGGEDNSGPQYLWYSDIYNIDKFTSTNWLSFPESITGMKTNGGLTHVFSYNYRWIMQPNYGSSDVSTGALDFGITRARGPGCVSNRSIAEGEYNNEHGIFFLSQNGVYFSNGMEAIRISGDIDILFQKKYSASDLFYADSFDEANWGSAAGVWYKDRYYLSYYGRGDSDNEATIVLNTKTGAWERDVLGGSVYPVMYALGEDSNGVPILYCCADNGEVYYLVENRTTVTDDGNAYQSDFQTSFIGTDLMTEVDWETLNIWVRSMTTSATSLIVKIFTIEDYDDTSSYNEWEEDPDAAIATITTAWTPNTAFKWHRLRIQLDDNTNYVYPRSRAISLQVYDDNDTALDFYLESLICTPLHDESR